MILDEKLIINVALTGMIPTQADNPHVPVTPDEICADVMRCYNAGAAIFHLHARGEDQRPTYKKEMFSQIVAAIKRQCPDDLILCVTTSGRDFNTFDKRSQVLDLTGPLKPDMASLTLGSMNFPQQASVNSPEMIQALAQKMLHNDIVPELEVFEPGMIDYSHYLIKKKILQEPLYYNLLLGSLGSTSATPTNLIHMVNNLPTNATWAATGIGRFQFQVNALAITMGGHVRVGLEDAIYMDTNKKDPASNVRLVERLVQVGQAVGRPPASSGEARAIIGLPKSKWLDGMPVQSKQNG